MSRLMTRDLAALARVRLSELEVAQIMVVQANKDLEEKRNIALAGCRISMTF